MLRDGESTGPNDQTTNFGFELQLLEDVCPLSKHFAAADNGEVELHETVPPRNYVF